MPRLGIAPRLLQPQCRVLLLYYLGVHFARIVVTDWNAELQNGVRSHNYRTATLAKRLMRLPRKQKVVSSNLTGGSFLFFLARAHNNNGGKNGPSGCVKTIWVTSQWPNWIRRLTTNQEIGGSSPSWDIFLQPRILHRRVCSQHSLGGMVCTGWMAERSKAPVSGTGLFGGVGSNPTPITFFCERTRF